ncbi:MAG: hypothetical protein ACRD2G_02515, partial [Terriglobia bacterium]
MTKYALLPAIAVLALMLAARPSLATTVTVKLTGVNGVTQGGYYVDPYFGTIDSSTAILVCDDFSHDTYINESWQANVSTFADLSGARFQQGTAAATLQDYDEAAYLYGQLISNPSDRGNITYALWSLFTPRAASSPGFTAGALAWLNQAKTQTYYT